MRGIARAWERVRNVPGLGRDVAALAVLMALGIPSAGVILSQYGWEAPWKSTFTFSADFEQASAVRPESRQEVRVAGVTVGKIEDAEPGPDGTARLTMSVDPDIEIYENARAVLRTKSPLNVMYVALDPGGPPAKQMTEDSVLPVSQTERPVQPYEVLNHLGEREQAALTSLVNQADAALASAPRFLPAGLGATRTTMERFRPVLEQLQTRRETISRLVSALSQIARGAGHDNERLVSLAASLQETLSVLATRDRELGDTLAQLPGFTTELRNAMSGTRELTRELNPVLDGLYQSADTLKPTMERLARTLTSARDLVDAAGPVVRKAKPILADLRPLVGDLHSAVDDLAPVTGYLPSATRRITPWMDDLAAFVYQTSSSFSLSDENGGLGRARLTIDLSNPLGGLAPQAEEEGSP